jgi:glycosyltransferase involved in cell wall biosynthesis
MKIALIGNMNNNNFAIMRYFRDLEADAHLLLLANDGRGNMEHFSPENDTWEMEKWNPYIHRKDIAGSIITLLGDPRKLQFPASAKHIRRQFGGYDAYVCSGYAPAILARAKIQTDIYYPYGVGIEGVGGIELKLYFRNCSVVKRIILGSVRKNLITAIRKARYCLNADMGLTRRAFEEMGKSFVPLAIPMVYNREHPPVDTLPAFLYQLKRKLAEYDVRILSHARHEWIRESAYSTDDWELESKHNDWLIRGFASFISYNTHVNALLLLFEYGKDVQASKALICDLGITSRVAWLPKMRRKEILCLLGLCDFGVGQFGVERGMMWGGTGWEVLAAGRPLMQTVNFTNDEFRETFGHDLPPILDVKSPDDVTRHLEEFVRHRETYEAIGERSKEWFNANNGIGLAKKWLELLKEGD